MNMELEVYQSDIEKAIDINKLSSIKIVPYQSYREKDSSNPKATKASELKVKNPTLIEISNGSISQYIEGEEKVIDYLS